jgi:hypothetical protein
VTPVNGQKPLRKSEHGFNLKSMEVNSVDFTKDSARSSVLHWSKRPVGGITQMKSQHETVFVNLHRDLEKISEKMYEYRQKLLEMQRSDDPDAVAAARKLLYNSMVSVGPIETYSNLLDQTCISAMDTYKVRY